MKRRPTPLPALLLVPLASWLSACAAPDQAVAEAVVTSALATNESGGVGKDVVETLEDTCLDDPELAAEAAAARPSVAFVPSSCVTKTASGNTVHVELDDCSGRFGRATANGGLDAVIHQVEACTLGVEVTDSGDLDVNGEPFDYYAGAEVHLLDDDMRDIDWQATWSGTTRRGHRISQSSELDIIARGRDNCVTIDGWADGEVKDIGYDLDIEGLSMCPDECPSAGTVRARVDGRFRDRDLTVTFDGSTVAHVEGSRGTTFEVDMICSASD